MVCRATGSTESSIWTGGSFKVNQSALVLPTRFETFLCEKQCLGPAVSSWRGIATHPTVAIGMGHVSSDFLLKFRPSFNRHGVSTADGRHLAPPKKLWETIVGIYRGEAFHGFFGGAFNRISSTV